MILPANYLRKLDHKNSQFAKRYHFTVIFDLLSTQNGCSSLCIHLFYSQVLRVRAYYRNNQNTNSDITYSLSGDIAENNNPFTISAYNGEIRVSEPSRLDYEVVKRYRLVVIAVSGE